MGLSYIEPHCIHGHTRKDHSACFIDGKPKPQWYKCSDMGFMDIETTGLDATFGTVLSWAIEPLNSDKTDYMVTDRDHILSEDEDKHLVKGCIQAMLKYPVIVTYYGTNFDLKFLRTRAHEHDLQFPGYGSIVHIDLYYQVRGKLKLSRNRLDNVAELHKLELHKTHLDPRVWRRAGQGFPWALKYVRDHNITDVKILKECFKRMEYTLMGSRRSI